MTPDIHPHWTSTDSGNTTPTPPPAPSSREEDSFFPIEGDEPEVGGPSSKQEHHHVQIAGGKQSSLFLVLSLISLGAASVGIVFYQGVNRIRADLLEEMAADSVIEIGQSTFSPASLTVEAGKLLEWKNTGSGNQELRSDQLDESGSPFLATPTIPAGTSFRFRVPPSLGGTMLTVRSSFNPLMSIAITVDPAKEVASSSSAGGTPAEPRPETATLPVAPSQPSTPSTPPTLPTPSPSPVPLIPSLPSSPSLPSIPSPSPNPSPTPTPAPVLHIGPTETVSQGVWPNQLRINRFTIGSGFAPTIPSPSPIHSAGRTQQQLHPAARRQPDTGPALWILSSLTLATTLFLFRRKKAF